MKFLILATTVSSILGSATAAKVANWGCNKGWSGDGSCEAAGRYTFCCKAMGFLETNYIYEFQHQKKDAYRQREDIEQRCGTDNIGYIACAY